MKRKPLSMDPEELRKKAKQHEKENKAFFVKIKKKQLNELDNTIHAIHAEVFHKINCLECANCCKNLGPRITNRDIEQIAKALRQKPSEIINTYLRIDEDADYVFRTMPCPFLASDHYCTIYNDRPKACREYPHTDRKKIFQIATLTIRNAETCPAVFKILELLKKRF